MSLYGKLIEGVLHYAPKTYTLEDGRIICNFNNSPVLMKRYGFKELKNEIPDYDPEIENIDIEGYEDQGDYISTIYKVTFNVTIEKLRKEKLALLNKLYDEYIENNPLMSPLKDGVLKPYECNTTKQNQLVQTISLYQLSQQSGIPYQCMWNSLNGPCENWSIEDLTTLSFQMQSYVYPLIHYQNNMMNKINSIEDIKELYNLEIDYSKAYEEENTI